MEEMKTLCAQWYFELKCECPHCNERIDLLEGQDLLLEKPISSDIPVHDTHRTKDIPVDCPECREKFKVDLVW